MFVTKLDISWLDSPFLLHQLRIKSQGDIGKLRAANVKRLVIDPDKTVVVDIPAANDAVKLPPIDAASATTDVAQPEPPLAVTVGLAPRTALAREMADARRIESQAKETLQRVLQEALAGNPIEVGQITPLISDTVESLVRNDQALLTLMHLERHGGTRQVTHAFGVLSLAMAVGHQLQLPRADLDVLGIAAMLHDVGWVRLPAALFGKGRPYSEHERRLVKQHVGLTMQTINKSPELPVAVGRIVAGHHERLDGSGYPQGLKADQLTAANDILAAVDEYDSLVHGLEEQPAMHPTAALRILFMQARAGKLRREVVDQLVQTLGVYPLTSIVELNTHEIGTVIELKRPHSLQPVVKLCYAADKSPLEPPLIIDLATQTERRIERVLNPEQEGVDPLRRLKLDAQAAS